MDHIDELLAADSQAWQQTTDSAQTYPTAAHAHRSSRPAANWFAPVTGALALALITVIVVFSIHHLISQGSTNPAVTSTPSAPPVPPEQAAAVAEISRLLLLSPVLPGAIPADHAPAPALAQDVASAQAPTLVTKARWWTATGSVATALNYLCTHLPAELIPSHPTAPDPRLKCQVPADGPGSLVIGQPDGVRYVQAQFEVAVVKLGSGVAIMAEAQARWLPSRTSAEQIPASATSIELILNRGAPATPSLQRTLTGSQVPSLVTLINSLPVQLLSNETCALNTGLTDVLRFHLSDRDVVITANVSGCAFVSVTSARVSQPGLDGGFLIDAAISSALHLPAGKAKPYPTNAAGKTYGGDRPDAEPATEPQLVLAMASNGKSGYLRKVDFEGPLPATPAEAVAQNAAAVGQTRVKPVYAVDGLTVIGIFIQPPSGLIAGG